MTPLAPLVTAFFRQHLAVEKGVSKHTLASYSYAFKFLCGYLSRRLGRPPSQLALEDLDAPMVRDFLAHLEQDGANTARTRNLRLIAIRSFMKYVEYEVPSALEQVRRVRAIASKRTEERLISHLSKEETQGLLDAPDPSTRTAGAIRPCCIWLSRQVSACRSWWDSASTTSNSTARIPASWCGGKDAGNGGCHFGRKRPERSVPGWSLAAHRRSRKCS